MNTLDTFAQAYDPSAATALENELILNWYPKRILKRLPSCREMSLLELGLGHGHTTLIFKESFRRHIVLEGSGKIIELFQKNHETSHSIDFIETYFEEYETEELFDVIVMGFILEHVDDPDVIVQRYKKFLKKGGRLYVAVPNAKCLNRRLGVAIGKIDDIYSLNANDIAQGHQRNFCLDSLRKLMAGHGLITTLEEGIYLKPLPLGYMKMMPEFEENLVAMCKVGVDFPELCLAILMELKVDD